MSSITSEKKIDHESMASANGSTRPDQNGGGRSDSVSWRRKTLAIGLSLAAGGTALYSLFNKGNLGGGGSTPSTENTAKLKNTPSNQKSDFSKKETVLLNEAILKELIYKPIDLERNLQLNRSSIPPVYRESLDLVNLGEAQNSPSLHDRDKSDIASIWPRRDQEKMGRYDGPSNSLNLTACGIQQQISKPIDPDRNLQANRFSIPPTYREPIPPLHERIVPKDETPTSAAPVISDPIQNEELSSLKPLKETASSDASPFSHLKQIGSYALSAAPWVVSILVTIWLGKRYLRINGEHPALPLSGFPGHGPFHGGGGLSTSVIPIIADSSIILALNREKIELSVQSNKFEDNEKRFHTLINLIKREPSDQNLLELSLLFENLIHHLTESLLGLDETFLNRVLEISTLREELKDAYNNVVNSVRTKHPFVKIPQTSRVGVKENVTNADQNEVVPLQKLNVALIRRIAGDGNCFYTSLATLLLEAIASGTLTLNDEWLNRHFIIPSYHNQDLLAFSSDLLNRVAENPSSLETILQDSDQMLRLVRYLRDMTAYSIQREWILDSLIQTPNPWLNTHLQVNSELLKEIREILRKYQNDKEGRVEKLKLLANTPDFQKLIDELMNQLALAPNSDEAQLIGGQAENWRGSLEGEYEDALLQNTSIHDLIEQYLGLMGRDAMQQSIAALSRQLAFPLEINVLGQCHIPSTVDGMEPLGSIVKSGPHYFIVYRESSSKK